MEKRSQNCLKFMFFFIAIHHWFKLLNAEVPSLDPKTLKIEHRILYVPPLDELNTVLSEFLSKNFAEVSVEIVDSPDLKKEPFSLAASGLGGKPTLVEVGGQSFSKPPPQKNKVYDVKTLATLLGHGDKSFVIGGGGGPWPYRNTKCQIITNFVLDTPESSSGSRIEYIDEISGRPVLETLPGNETRFGFLVNLFLSEGKPGKVIKVHVKNRTGQEDFITCMQNALASHYPGKLIGLGGTFITKGGKVKLRVLKGFSEEAVLNPLEINDKKFYLYNASTPLISVGTFFSFKTDLDLTLQHFHTFSDHGEGGHYLIDTTPEIVEYLGYFHPGEILYRVDQPPRF